MRSRNRFLKTFYVLIFIFLLILINNSGSRDGIRTWVFDTTQNFFKTTHFVFYHLAGGFEKIKKLAEVYKERDQLEKEVSSLKLKLIRSQEAAIENERLRALLDFQNRNEFEGISGQIIGRDLQAISDIIILDRGKADNINLGTVLISDKGLVGHVVLAGEKHSKGLLISDIHARVSAMVQETRDVGIIEGTPTPLLKLKNININATVKIGDIVITSGFGDIFPKGIPIGAVEMIGTEQDNLYLYALVKPFVNFSKLEEVLCLITE